MSILFPKGISPKVNVMAQLEFELTNYNIADQSESCCVKLRILFVPSKPIDLLENYSYWTWNYIHDQTDETIT